MRVGAIRIEEGSRDRRVRISATVTYGDRTNEDYWFEFPDECRGDLATHGDPWVALLLPLAMELGEPLEVDAPVDRYLLEGLEKLQDIWRCWYPRLERVAVLPREVTTSVAGSDRGAACFFSGGVDSFFSALQHQAGGGSAPIIRDLVFVWGFDIRLDQPDLIERLRPGLLEVARELGANLIVASTNIRETRWKETNWAELSHGAALGAVGLCLQARRSDLLVPSTESYLQLYPWGSHALTDPLFSTGRMRVHHDGAECSRLEKVRRLTRSPLAMKSLRVCWQSPDATNCGKCQKCQRTMLQLEVLGELGSCGAFSESSLDLHRLRHVFIEWDLVPDYREIRLHAKRLGKRQLVRALDYALSRSKAVEFGFDVAKNLQRVPKGHLLARRLRQYLHRTSIR